MANELILRGVPASILNDSWWLGGDPGQGGGAKRPGLRAAPQMPKARAVLGLLGLIAAADVLFWNAVPGLSLAIFAGLIFAVAAWVGPRRRAVGGPLAVLVLGVLPVVEHLQPLSFGFLLAGLLSSLVLLRLAPGAGRARFASGLERLVASLPTAGLTRLRMIVPALSVIGWQGLEQLRGDAARDQGSLAAALRRTLRNWAFPLGGALVLATLLIDANPVLERFVVALFAVEIDVLDLAQRGLFWLGIGLMLWPLLEAPEAGEAPRPLPVLALPGFGLNPGSVLRALVVFNAMLAVQSVMDMSILLGGAALPDGMTHAQYAHRGAYPLLATAMLAGAFALAARPFLGEHRALTPLTLLWLAQNVALGLSAMLRLKLYVEAYGLTYLRLHAGIWMGLVVAGLALTAWQILRARSNGWLMVRAAGLGLVTLYVCAFVNFAAIIAGTNLQMKADGWTRPLDHAYLCGLGPTAHKAIAQKLAAYPDLPGYRTLQLCMVADFRESIDWREWGFRSARVRAYLLDQDKDKSLP